MLTERRRKKKKKKLKQYKTLRRSAGRVTKNKKKTFPIPHPKTAMCDAVFLFLFLFFFFIFYFSFYQWNNSNAQSFYQQNRKKYTQKQCHRKGPILLILVFHVSQKQTQIFDFYHILNVFSMFR